MPDAAISQNNPVSGTIYPVLPATLNAVILGIEGRLTWGVTQPTPLTIVAIVDGRTRIFNKVNPISVTGYAPCLNNMYDVEGNQIMDAFPLTTSCLMALKVCSGKSVQIGVSIAWAVTQPTPLNCRVKYAVLI